MIPIDAAARPPLATLLWIALPSLAAAAALLRGAPAAARRRALVRALAAAAALTVASTILVSERHAGTGTEVARGWPKAVHARWESFDRTERRAGVAWRGVAEDLFVFAATSAALLAAAARVRSR